MKTNTLLIIAGVVILIAILIAVYSSRNKVVSTVATTPSTPNSPPRSVGITSPLTTMVINTNSNGGDTSRIIRVRNI